mgnify:CR=1 FL=1
MTFAKTKIICTIGPATQEKTVLLDMVQRGMDIARLNLSHGKIEDHISRIATIREVEQEIGQKVTILGDLQGPKIRIGKVENGEVEIFDQQELIITTEPMEFGNSQVVSTSYKDLVKEVKEGNLILLDDGYIHLICEKVDKSNIYTRVIKGGKLKSNKGIVVPGSKSNAPSLSEKDLEDLKAVLEAGIDMIALSFVKNANDVRELKTAMKIFGRRVPIIAKIERGEAFEHIDEIIDEADGVMVARGDLGLEMPIEEIPILQKELIRRSNLKAKPVITATQMLESMINNPMPTRAEVSDIANAVLDGTDAVMLSAETSVGKFPLEAVSYMNKIITKTEKSLNKKIKLAFHNHHDADNISDSIALSAVLLARNISAKAIVTITHSAYTARKISKYRPNIPIISITNDINILAYLNLIWGVYPLFNDNEEINDEMIEFINSKLVELNFAEKGDFIVLVTGLTEQAINKNNLIKIINVNP